MERMIDYGRLVDEAMHVIVRNVLKKVSVVGLPGNHHFFISFLTKHPGVRISQSLANKYPSEMTIVLQYQFYELKVDNNGFSVVLSFNGVKEEIYVPMMSITTFADPSVQFGLQFRENDVFKNEKVDLELEDLALITSIMKKDAAKKPGAQASVNPGAANNVVAFEKFKKKKP
jgi:hypothetical protein